MTSSSRARRRSSPISTARSPPAKPAWPARRARPSTRARRASAGVTTPRGDRGGDQVGVATQLFGPDRHEIRDLDAWLDHAPPENGAAQWRDGYSAKEQAKAWLRAGDPSVPD